MASRVTMRHKRREAPQWIFPWQGLNASSFPKAFIVLLVSGAFAILLTSVRVRVAAPMPWAAPKASLIQVPNDAEGRSLTLRAREGGPFPSRFEPSAWELATAIEQAAYQAARWRPPPYAPVLRKLSGQADRPRLSATDTAVLPARQPIAKTASIAGNHLLVPALYPLSGITPAEMPRETPPFAGKISSTMVAESWRFLLRLSPAGGVLDCVSLTGGDESEKTTLEAWLRRVSFELAGPKETRWIAVGLSFTTQPDDGANVR